MKSGIILHCHSLIPPYEIMKKEYLVLMSLLSYYDLQCKENISFYAYIFRSLFVKRYRTSRFWQMQKYEKYCVVYDWILQMFLQKSEIFNQETKGVAYGTEISAVYSESM